jgi:hypothetical protein
LHELALAFSKASDVPGHLKVAHWMRRLREGARKHRER